MNLRILLPTMVFLDTPVSKVVAESEDGSFCLLPRHRDYLTALVPGLLSFQAPDGSESFVAVGDGVLIKSGPDVLVSTRNAARSDSLGELQQIVREQFETLDDRERVARTVIARLEADFMRRFLQLGEHSHV